MDCSGFDPIRAPKGAGPGFTFRYLIPCRMSGAGALCWEQSGAGVRLDRSFQANPLLVAHFVAPGVERSFFHIVQSGHSVPGEPNKIKELR